MIVTHTINAAGHRRVYLGGKSSVECWIEPDEKSDRWSVHAGMAPTAYPIPLEQFRSWVVDTLLALAEILGVPPAELKAVSFERISALHTPNPADYRRVPLPKRQAVEHGYMATEPGSTASTMGHRRTKSRHKRSGLEVAEPGSMRSDPTQRRK